MNRFLTLFMVFLLVCPTVWGQSADQDDLMGDDDESYSFNVQQQQLLEDFDIRLNEAIVRDDRGQNVQLNTLIAEVERLFGGTEQGEDLVKSLTTLKTSINENDEADVIRGLRDFAVYSADIDLNEPLTRLPDSGSGSVAAGSPAAVPSDPNKVVIFMDPVEGENREILVYDKETGEGILYSNGEGFYVKTYDSEIISSDELSDMLSYIGSNVINDPNTLLSVKDGDQNTRFVFTASDASSIPRMPRIAQANTIPEDADASSSSSSSTEGGFFSRLFRPITDIFKKNEPQTNAATAQEQEPVATQGTSTQNPQTSKLSFVITYPEPSSREPPYQERITIDPATGTATVVEGRINGKTETIPVSIDDALFIVTLGDQRRIVSIPPFGERGRMQFDNPQVALTYIRSQLPSLPTQAQSPPSDTEDSLFDRQAFTTRTDHLNAIREAREYHLINQEASQLDDNLNAEAVSLTDEELAAAIAQVENAQEEILRAREARERLALQDFVPSPSVQTEDQDAEQLSDFFSEPESDSVFGQRDTQSVSDASVPATVPEASNINQRQQQLLENFENRLAASILSGGPRQTLQLDALITEVQQTFGGTAEGTELLLSLNTLRGSVLRGESSTELFRIREFALSSAGEIDLTRPLTPLPGADSARVEEALAAPAEPAVAPGTSVEGGVAVAESTEPAVVADVPTSQEESILSGWWNSLFGSDEEVQETPDSNTPVTISFSSSQPDGSTKRHIIIYDANTQTVSGYEESVENSEGVSTVVRSSSSQTTLRGLTQEILVKDSSLNVVLSQDRGESVPRAVKLNTFNSFNDLDTALRGFSPATSDATDGASANTAFLQTITNAALNPLDTVGKLARAVGGGIASGARFLGIGDDSPEPEQAADSAPQPEPLTEEQRAQQVYDRTQQTLSALRSEVVTGSTQASAQSNEDAVRAARETITSLSTLLDASELPADQQQRLRNSLQNAREELDSAEDTEDSLDVLEDVLEEVNDISTNARNAHDEATAAIRAEAIAAARRTHEDAGEAARIAQEERAAQEAVLVEQARQAHETAQEQAEKAQATEAIRLEREAAFAAELAAAQAELDRVKQTVAADARLAVEQDALREQNDFISLSNSVSRDYDAKVSELRDELNNRLEDIEPLEVTNYDINQVLLTVPSLTATDYTLANHLATVRTFLSGEDSAQFDELTTAAQEIARTKAEIARLQESLRAGTSSDLQQLRTLNEDLQNYAHDYATEYDRLISRGIERSLFYAEMKRDENFADLLEQDEESNYKLVPRSTYVRTHVVTPDTAVSDVEVARRTASRVIDAEDAVLAVRVKQERERFGIDENGVAQALLARVVAFTPTTSDFETLSYLAEQGTTGVSSDFVDNLISDYIRQNQDSDDRIARRTALELQIFQLRRSIPQSAEDDSGAEAAFDASKRVAALEAQLATVETELEAERVAQIADDFFELNEEQDGNELTPEVELFLRQAAEAGLQSRLSERQAAQAAAEAAARAANQKTLAVLLTNSVTTVPVQYVNALSQLRTKGLVVDTDVFDVTTLAKGVFTKGSTEYHLADTLFWTKEGDTVTVRHIAKEKGKDAYDKPQSYERLKEDIEQHVTVKGGTDATFDDKFTAYLNVHQELQAIMRGYGFDLPLEPNKGVLSSNPDNTIEFDATGSTPLSEAPVTHVRSRFFGDDITTVINKEEGKTTILKGNPESPNVKLVEDRFGNVVEFKDGEESVTRTAASLPATLQGKSIAIGENSYDSQTAAQLFAQDPNLAGKQLTPAVLAELGDGSTKSITIPISSTEKTDDPLFGTKRDYTTIDAIRLEEGKATRVSYMATKDGKGARFDGTGIKIYDPATGTERDATPGDLNALNGIPGLEKTEDMKAAQEALVDRQREDYRFTLQQREEKIARGIESTFNAFANGDIFRGLSLGIFRGYEKYKGLAQISSLFISDEKLQERRAQLDEEFCELGLGGSDCWTSLMCGSWSDFVPGPQEGTVVEADFSGSFRFVAHIEAERSEPLLFVNDSTLQESERYLYRITYTFKNARDAPVHYNLIFTNNNSQTFPWFAPNEPEGVVESGASVSRTGTGSEVFYQTRKYTKVCMTFDPPINTKRGERVDELCRNIAETDSTPTNVGAPGPVDVTRTGQQGSVSFSPGSQVR